MARNISADDGPVNFSTDVGRSLRLAAVIHFDESIRVTDRRKAKRSCWFRLMHFISKINFIRRLGPFVRGCVTGVVLLLRMLPSQVSVPHIATALYCVATASLTTTMAAEAEKRTFNLPRGDAAETLKDFATAAGTPIVYLVDRIRGATTNSVSGELTPREALEQMLINTDLEAAQDSTTGGLVVSSKFSTRKDPANHRQTTKPPKMTTSRNIIAIAVAWIASAVTGNAQITSATNASDDVVVLHPFEVTAKGDLGYRKLGTVTSSRVGVQLIKEPLAIEVISSELLKDFSVSEASHVFRYTSSVTVGEGEIGQAGIFTMRGFQMPRYLNGVRISSASSIEPFLDMENIDRVEIAKGSVGLFFANTTPNGVANYVTKTPQFIAANSLRLSYGSYNYSKVSLDMQNVIKERNIAWRLISAFYAHDGRVNDTDRETLLIAPSVTYRPNSKLEISAGLNYTDQKNPWGAANVQNWQMAINPQTYIDLTNPSPAILNFMKNKYALTTDAEARAKVEQRYGKGVQTGLSGIQGWNTNWQSDTFERTGVVPHIVTGSTIDWGRFSPAGDKFNSIPGNLDGDTLMSEFKIVLMPLPDLSMQYHWIRMHSQMNLIYQNILANGGLRPDGRIWNSTVEYLGITDNGMRAAYSDAQMLDIVYDMEFAGIKNKFIFGAELRRNMAQNGSSTIDYAKAIPTTSVDNTPLTGVNAYRYWDPFGSQPKPDPYTLVSGPNRVTSRSINENRDFYFSYRGQALNDKLNVLLGMRNVRILSGRVTTNGLNDNAWTVGAVYEVVPGFRPFVSAGKNVLLTSTLSISGAGVTEADNPQRLDSEKGTDLEIGVKSDWRNNTISGSVSYYEVVRDGIVRSNFNKNSTEPRNYDANPNNNVTWSENGGRVRAEGVDGDIAWTPSRKFQAILNLSYEYDVRVVTDPTIDLTKPWLLTYVKAFQRRPMKSPLWRANLITKYNFVDGLLKNLSFGSAIRSCAEYSPTDGPTTDLVVPQETILDLFATYTSKFSGMPVEYTINVVNATDTINDLTRSNGLEARLTVGLKF